MKLALIKDNAKGKTFQADGFKLLYRHKGSIAGDNAENVTELVYLITGSAKVTVKKTAEVQQAPAVFKVPSRTYHKIEATADIVMVIFEG